jgi:Cu-Zn family superoxide dismutase
MRRILFILVVALLGAATVAFAAPGDQKRRGDDRHGRIATAKLIDAAGDRIGRVFLKQRGRDRAVWVVARVRDLPPGFHGFHIHTTGRCEPPGFTSAGGHYNPSGAQHRDHAGDLPTLLVNGNGKGLLAFATDRFTLAELRDADGSAVMVHELPDNYANIPERYGGPDAETRMHGDAGSRLACGEVR